MSSGYLAYLLLNTFRFFSVFIAQYVLVIYRIYCSIHFSYLVCSLLNTILLFKVFIAQYVPII
jgi:hypothetical protein